MVQVNMQEQMGAKPNSQQLQTYERQNFPKEHETEENHPLRQSGEAIVGLSGQNMNMDLVNKQSIFDQSYK